ncbi:hypothetical protein BHQ15_08485 [Mycolicibacillus koreensis]|nr:hypothetical protein BHQ15_08485 [Mycolicibacillus koreensis]
MELSTGPTITAGVALAAAGMIAATPVLPAAPVVNVPDIQLVGFADTLEGWMKGFNDFLYPGVLDLNQGLVGAEIGLEKLVSPLFDFDFLGPLHEDFSDTNILNGIVNRGFNVFNMGLGGVQSSLLGVFGAEFTSGMPSSDPGAGIINSLLVGLNPANVFNSGQIGGLEGMFVQGLQAFANLTGFPGPDLMQGIQDGLINFNTGLVDFLKDFNHTLVTSQWGLEEMIFGTDSALNGVINRSFNVLNMFLDAGQQGFLGVLGADFPSQAMTSSLLATPDYIPDPIFATGEIGGLEAVLGNSYLVLADLIGGLLNPEAMFGNLDLFGIFNPWEILSGLLGL